MSAHHISNSADVRNGNAKAPNRSQLGIPLEGTEAQAVRVISLGAPAVADVDGICAAQAIAGAGAALINGALASGGAVVLDVPRCVQVDSSDAGDTTQTVTVTGTDVYGQDMVEEIALNGTTDVLGGKAFKTVTAVAVDDAMAGNLTVGTTKKLGLPYRPVVGGFIRGILNENTSDAGTYVAPERDESAADTVDVRGTYAGAGTYDGTNVYSVAIAVQNGPDDEDAYGIAQYAG